MTREKHHKFSTFWEAPACKLAFPRGVGLGTAQRTWLQASGFACIRKIIYPDLNALGCPDPYHPSFIRSTFCALVIICQYLDQLDLLSHYTRTLGALIVLFRSRSFYPFCPLLLICHDAGHYLQIPKTFISSLLLIY